MTDTIDMIEDGFDERTFANMMVALTRACERLPEACDNHPARKRIALKILECAQSGRTGLTDLTAVAKRAAVEISSQEMEISQE